MIYLNNLLWIFVLIFAVIGIFRGAAKELLVTIAVLSALFVLSLLEKTQFFTETLASLEEGMVLFWVRTAILGLMVLAGYQTPNSRINFKNQLTTNDKIEKATGFIIGALNGFLIFGTLWFYLHAANYPGLALVSPAEGVIPELNEKAQKFIEFLPPSWLQGTVLYVIVAFLLIFIFIMVI